MPIFDRILAFIRIRFSSALDLVEIIQEIAILRILLLSTLTSLPNSVRDQVGLLYLLARLADTIADSKTKDVDSLIEALDGYQNLLVNDEKLGNALPITLSYSV